MIVKVAKAKWDEWAIRAELKRRRLSFNAMALESGLSASSLRAALSKPSTNANRFLAKKLDLTPHELWPTWFFEDGELMPLKLRKRLKAERRGESSHESRSAA